MSTPKPPTSSCPEPTTLQQFLNDQLSGADSVPVTEHIDTCPLCQQALARMVGTLPGPLDALPPVPNRAPLRGNASSESSIQIPGYEILGEVGRGGMGVVYKARALRLDRIVALKMLLAGTHAGEMERARFVHEAESVARLQHPHIVALYEAGQHGNLPYFTLEFIAGGSLADFLNGTPLPPMTAARLVEQVARGMHYAHERGIVHRDLKPANILLVKSEERGAANEVVSSSLIPKITDFGLAKNVAVTNALTTTGAVFGTPSYMAPEQAVGASKEVGAGADVFALGAVLYECLTGRPPFQGPTPTETLLNVLQSEPVPPSYLQRTVPRDLETICLKCLRKGVPQRYASALELAEDLRHFQAGEPIRARPVGRVERMLKWCKRHPAVAALSAILVLFIVVAGSLVTWQWRQAVATLEELRLEKAARARRQVAALPDSSAARVPAILEELASSRDDVLPLLRQLYEQEQDRGRKMRLALALLPVEPEMLRQPLVNWMLTVEDPAEVLLVRDALQPYAAKLIGPLWAKAQNSETSDAERFRALVALAAYDPQSSHWQASGPVAVAYLLWTNPLHRGRWADALRAVDQHLFAPLADASYYPLKAGTTWHYKTVKGGGAEETRIQQVVKIEKIDGISLARLDVTLPDATPTLTEHLSTTATGLFRHRYLGLDIVPPLCLLKFPIKIGETWESEYTAGVERGKTRSLVGAEDVEVPAGKFKTVFVKLDVVNPDGNITKSVTFWYAPDIGPVKQLVISPLTKGDVLVLAYNTAAIMGAAPAIAPVLAGSFAYLGTNNTTLLLEKFEEGK
ncbi:MAG TPA: serine/threonine-protein kinase [Gemmataceae bacterium]|nr:serine/threonine-protein kinase [Gemmataceae bacterium]